MAFNLDDIIIDRIQFGVAEDSTGNLLYTLTQLSDASIQISATSKDANDAQGTLVKRFWQGKTGTFSATNAMLNLNVLSAQTGGVKSTAQKTGVPKIVKVKGADASKGLDITGFVKGEGEGTGDSITVYALGNNGALGKAYSLAQAASTSAYAITTASSKTTLALPTDGADNYLVKYTRTAADTFYMYNSAEEFPSTVKLTLKALAVDPCSPDTLRACYIVLPSFQPSPEVDFSLTTDATFNYSGDLQVSYCSDEKVLYEIYMAAGDEEGTAK